MHTYTCLPIYSCIKIIPVFHLAWGKVISKMFNWKKVCYITSKSIHFVNLPPSQYSSALSSTISMSFLSHSSSHHRGIAATRSNHAPLLPYFFLVTFSPRTNTFNVFTLNIRSQLNPLKFTAISDLAESRHIDLFALTEIWITYSSILVPNSSMKLQIGRASCRERV